MTQLTLKRKLFIFIVISTGFFGWLTFYLSPQDELAQVDAIIAISGGNTNARTREAVDLYKAGWASTIIFSGAALDPLSPSNAEVMRMTALDLGVPPEAILIDEASQDTKENATNTKAITDSSGIESFILVTSPYHQRRAYLEFRDQFDDSNQILNHSASDSEWSRGDWWQSVRGWQLTVSEAIGIPLSYIR